MLNALLALVPLVVALVAIYAFFSMAIDVRAIRRLLERDADRDARTG